jgi:hypothetical protein
VALRCRNYFLADKPPEIPPCINSQAERDRRLLPQSSNADNGEQNNEFKMTSSPSKESFTLFRRPMAGGGAALSTANSIPPTGFQFWGRGGAETELPRFYHRLLK